MNLGDFQDVNQATSDIQRKNFILLDKFEIGQIIVGNHSGTIRMHLRAQMQSCQIEFCAWRQSFLTNIYFIHLYASDSILCLIFYKNGFIFLSFTTIARTVD